MRENTRSNCLRLVSSPSRPTLFSFSLSPSLPYSFSFWMGASRPFSPLFFFRVSRRAINLFEGQVQNSCSPSPFPFLSFFSSAESRYAQTPTVSLSPPLLFPLFLSPPGEGVVTDVVYSACISPPPPPIFFLGDEIGVDNNSEALFSASYLPSPPLFFFFFFLFFL